MFKEFDGDSCPKCGASLLDVDWYTEIDGYDAWYYTSCDECGCHIIDAGNGYQYEE